MNGGIGKNVSARALRLVLVCALLAGVLVTWQAPPAGAANELGVNVSLRDAATDAPLTVVRRGQGVEAVVHITNTTSGPATNLTLSAPAIAGLTGNATASPAGPYTINAGATQTVVLSGLEGSFQSSSPDPSVAVTVSGQAPDDAAGADADTDPDPVSGAGSAGADLRDFTATISFVQNGQVVTELQRGTAVTLRLRMFHHLASTASETLRIPANGITLASQNGLTGTPTHQAFDVTEAHGVGPNFGTFDVTGLTVTSDPAVTNVSASAHIPGTVPDDTLQPSDAGTARDDVDATSNTATAAIRSVPVLTLTGNPTGGSVVEPGSAVALAASVTNPSDGFATVGGTITITAPTGLAITSSSYSDDDAASSDPAPGGTGASRSVQLPALVTGKTGTLVVIATVAEGAAGTLVSTASYDAPAPLSDQNASLSYTLAPDPTVGLAIAGTPADASVVSRGDAVSITVTATNTASSGARPATDVAVAVPLSPGLSITSLSTSTGEVASYSPGTTPTVNTTFASLAPGSQATLTMLATVANDAAKSPNADILVGPATATFAPPAGSEATPSGSVAYELAPAADVSVQLSPSTSEVDSGDMASLTATLLNAGPESTTRSFVLSVASTSGAGTPTFVSPFPTGCSSVSGGTLTCSAIDFIGAVPFSISVTQPEAGTATVTATLAASPVPDPNTANDGPASAAVVFAPTEALTVQPSSVSFGSQPVQVPSATRTVVVSSTGTGPVSIADVALGGSDAAAFTVVDDTCSSSSLTPGATCELAVLFTPTRTGSATAVLAIESDAPGPHQVALSGSGAPNADVRVSLGATPNPVKNGDLLTYTATAANSGPTAATGAQFTLTLSPSVQFDTMATPTGWSCNVPARGATGTVACSRSTFAAGASSSFIVKVKVVAPGKSSVSSSTGISTSSFDGVPGNDTATVTTSIKGRR